MTLIEFIGFLVSIFTLFFLYIKKNREERRRRQHPEQNESEEAGSEDALKDFLRSLEMDMDEMEENQKKQIRQPPSPPPLPPVVNPKKTSTKPEKRLRTVQDEFSYKTKIEDFRQVSAVEERNFQPGITNKQFEDFGAHVVSEDLNVKNARAYQITDSLTESRLSKFVHQIPSRRDLLIYQEIMMRPKAFRQSVDSYDYP